MRKTIITLCLALSAGHAAAERCQQEGSRWRCSSGVYDRPPPSWDEGRLDSSMPAWSAGPEMRGSVRYQVIGDTIYGSDGTRCQVLGNQVLCN